MIINLWMCKVNWKIIKLHVRYDFWQNILILNGPSQNSWQRKGIKWNWSKFVLDLYPQNNCEFCALFKKLATNLYCFTGHREGLMLVVNFWLYVNKICWLWRMLAYLDWDLSPFYQGQRPGTYVDGLNLQKVPGSVSAFTVMKIVQSELSQHNHRLLSKLFFL